MADGEWKPSKEEIGNFLQACSSGNLQEVNDIVEAHSSIIYSKNSRNQSGLGLACLTGRVEIVDSLLKVIKDQGLDIKKILDLKDDSGCTPLINAVYAEAGKKTKKELIGRSGGHPDFVNACPITTKLLDLQADPKITTLNKRNIAHIACTKKHGLKVLKLLKHRDDLLDELIEAKDVWGATPFDIAEYKRYREQITYLELTYNASSSDDGGRSSSEGEPHRGQIFIPKTYTHDRDELYPNLTQSIAQRQHLIDQAGWHCGGYNSKYMMKLSPNNDLFEVMMDDPRNRNFRAEMQELIQNPHDIQHRMELDSESAKLIQSNRNLNSMPSPKNSTRPASGHAGGGHASGAGGHASGAGGQGAFGRGAGGGEGSSADGKSRPTSGKSRPGSAKSSTLYHQIPAQVFELEELGQEKDSRYGFPNRTDFLQNAAGSVTRGQHQLMSKSGVPIWQRNRGRSRRKRQGGRGPDTKEKIGHGDRSDGDYNGSAFRCGGDYLNPPAGGEIRHDNLTHDQDHIRQQNMKHMDNEQNGIRITYDMHISNTDQSSKQESQKLSSRDTSQRTKYIHDYARKQKREKDQDLHKAMRNNRANIPFDARVEHTHWNDMHDPYQNGIPYPASKQNQMMSVIVEESIEGSLMISPHHPASMQHDSPHQTPQHGSPEGSILQTHSLIIEAPSRILHSPGDQTPAAPGVTPELLSPDGSQGSSRRGRSPFIDRKKVIRSPRGDFLLNSPRLDNDNDIADGQKNHRVSSPNAQIDPIIDPINPAAFPKKVSATATSPEKVKIGCHNNASMPGQALNKAGSNANATSSVISIYAQVNQARQTQPKPPVINRFPEDLLTFYVGGGHQSLTGANTNVVIADRALERLKDRPSSAGGQGSPDKMAPHQIGMPRPRSETADKPVSGSRPGSPSKQMNIKSPVGPNMKLKGRSTISKISSQNSGGSMKIGSMGSSSLCRSMTESMGKSIGKEGKELEHTTTVSFEQTDDQSGRECSREPASRKASSRNWPGKECEGGEGKGSPIASQKDSPEGRKSDGGHKLDQGSAGGYADKNVGLESSNRIQQDTKPAALALDAQGQPLMEVRAMVPSAGTTSEGSSAISGAPKVPPIVQSIEGLQKSPEGSEHVIMGSITHAIPAAGSDENVTAACNDEKSRKMEIGSPKSSLKSSPKPASPGSPPPQSALGSPNDINAQPGFLRAVITGDGMELHQTSNMTGGSVGVAGVKGVVIKKTPASHNGSKHSNMPVSPGRTTPAGSKVSSPKSQRRGSPTGSERHVLSHSQLKVSDRHSQSQHSQHSESKEPESEQSKLPKGGGSAGGSGAGRGINATHNSTDVKSDDLAPRVQYLLDRCERAVSGQPSRKLSLEFLTQTGSCGVHSPNLVLTIQQMKLPLGVDGMANQHRDRTMQPPTVRQKPVSVSQKLKANSIGNTSGYGSNTAGSNTGYDTKNTAGYAAMVSPISPKQSRPHSPDSMGVPGYRPQSAGRPLSASSSGKERSESAHGVNRRSMRLGPERPFQEQVRIAGVGGRGRRGGGQDHLKNMSEEAFIQGQPFTAFVPNLALNNQIIDGPREIGPTIGEQIAQRLQRTTFGASASAGSGSSSGGDIRSIIPHQDMKHYTAERTKADLKKENALTVNINDLVLAEIQRQKPKPNPLLAPKPLVTGGLACKAGPMTGDPKAAGKIYRGSVAAAAKNNRPSVENQNPHLATSAANESLAVSALNLDQEQGREFPTNENKQAIRDHQKQFIGMNVEANHPPAYLRHFNRRQVAEKSDPLISHQDPRSQQQSVGCIQNQRLVVSAGNRPKSHSAGTGDGRRSAGRTGTCSAGGGRTGGIIGGDQYVPAEQRLGMNSTNRPLNVKVQMRHRDQGEGEWVPMSVSGNIERGLQNSMPMGHQLSIGAGPRGSGGPQQSMSMGKQLSTGNIPPSGGSQASMSKQKSDTKSGFGMASCVQAHGMGTVVHSNLEGAGGRANFEQMYGEQGSMRVQITGEAARKKKEEKKKADKEFKKTLLGVLSPSPGGLPPL